MRVGVTIVFFCCALAGCVVDFDGDGVREIMFVGDSNTHFLPCAYPIVWQARHDPATVRGYDEGVFGDRARHWVEEGLLVAAIDRDRPDAVVIALGTNDLGIGDSPEDALFSLWVLYRQAEDHGVAGYVATVPPIYDPENVDPERNAVLSTNVAALNEMVRAVFPPARVVDFDSWMPTAWTPDYYCLWWGGGDGVHVNCRTHEIRADLIDAVLDGVAH